MRKLALDVGTKTCGIAISDSRNIIAIAKETIFFDEENWKALVSEIKKYLEEYKIDQIIVGYPKFYSGDKSSMTLKVETFIEELRRAIDTKYTITKFDEYLSTKKALHLLRKMKLRKKAIKTNKDALSAQIILTEYLNLYNK